MPDQNTPLTGKDVRIVVTADGVPRFVHDQVVRFTRRPVYDEIQTKNMGTDGSKIDKVFSHWEGTIEFAVEDPTLDEMVDVINAARRNRVPIVINVGETLHYRNGAVKRYTYPDIKADFDSSAARAEAKSFTINWKSGEHRIAA